MKFHKAFFTICIFSILLLFIDGIQLCHFTPGTQNKKPDNLSITPYNEPSSSSVSSSKAINVVILGLDGEEVRSDTIILLNINKDNGGLNMLSIPRDTKVNTKRGYGKINSLIGTGGEKLVCAKIEEMTGLQVDFFVSLNYEGFKEIIDLLGGVEITIKKNMNYDDAFQNLHIHLKKGTTRLNGEMAEQYVRYRKGNRQGVGYKYGDLTRMEVQQDFIISLIKQKAKWRYLQKLKDVFLVLKQHMKTNIEIKDADLFVDIVKNLKVNDIKTYTLSGESIYIHQIWYYAYDKEAIKHLIDYSFYK